MNEFLEDLAAILKDATISWLPGVEHDAVAKKMIDDDEEIEKTDDEDNYLCIWVVPMEEIIRSWFDLDEYIKKHIPKELPKASRLVIFWQVSGYWCGVPINMKTHKPILSDSAPYVSNAHTFFQMCSTQNTSIKRRQTNARKRLRPSTPPPVVDLSDIFELPAQASPPLKMTSK